MGYAGIELLGIGHGRNGKKDDNLLLICFGSLCRTS